ncbi:hypothetical protein Ocin01_19968 [Orchesella cincta]|uniref:Uncharacterized protein n=1 Tax=Orchesella cincta TaxID=48709 RepID=A0A1D2M187_ORCCI|nr:hypothetical protein Ocin01_19968 [Orchesella cincta]
MKLSDAGYHGVAALLLFIAAIVYIFSAEKIHDIVGGGNRITKFKRGEKLAAGALTIIHALLYGIVGFLIFRS